MSARTTRLLAIVPLAALVLPTLAACGGGAPSSSGEAPKAPASAGQPTKAAEPAATNAPAQPSSSGDPQSRVSEALGLLTGSGDEASVFPSYHIEVMGSSSVLDW